MSSLCTMKGQLALFIFFVCFCLFVCFFEYAYVTEWKIHHSVTGSVTFREIKYLLIWYTAVRDANNSQTRRFWAAVNEEGYFFHKNNLKKTLPTLKEFTKNKNTYFSQSEGTLPIKSLINKCYCIALSKHHLQLSNNHYHTERNR